ncbi:NADH:flavin oxidoreductase [Nocardioides piscis]|uniref:NADH:flavin oxidoreductase n=1 Tax=Nocardioides piscis TaxID=2714938 RepID=UPI001FE55021|nr:NADH:flavin oxidoreductase [Nocardioides piscis]
MTSVPDVLAPATLGPVSLRNRVVKAATFEGRTPDGRVSDELIDFHARLARGQVGLTTVAYLAVSPEGRTHRDVLVVGPHTRDGLARLAGAVHAEGGAIAGQVGHAGPVANGRSNGVRAVAASRMPSPLSMQMVRTATRADISRVTRAYVDAARVLVDAGFDVLELHMAHSYLISSFLAPGLNRRKDEWGGPLANRARLAREVARAVREEVGDAAAVTAKVSLSDGFKGGVTTQAGLELAQLLESDGHLDALQLSGGSSLMNPMYLFRGDPPRAEFAAVMPPLVRWG